jgi:AAA15 family ATPase/GTPase
MSNFIKHLQIRNFKSIRDVELDCERINLFIGEPNVGKSNVLEAISLMGCGYSKPSDRFMNDFIRYEEVSDLFHFDNILEPIDVVSNIGRANLRHISNLNLYEIVVGNSGLFNELDAFKSLNEIEKFIIDKSKSKVDNHSIPMYYGSFQADGRANSIPIRDIISPIKKYTFSPYNKEQNLFSSFLLPPFGRNIYTIVEKSHDLKRKYGKEFKKYDLDLVLDIRAKRFEIQRRNDDLVYKIPYTSMADTLQRFMFYIAAIESNKDSIILFEEIESHSFPRYVQELAQKMIDSKDNQFFATTHSPYLLNTIMSEKSDIAIFMATYEDFETKVKRLDDVDISELLNYGVDVFYNLNAFDNEPKL